VAINLARYLLDTNIALYFLGGRLLIPLPVGEFYISIISEMEMLSYPAISGDEEIKIRQFLTQVAIVDVNESVKNNAIILRKKYRLKLPDAIICSTALFTSSILLSNDVQLTKVSEISVDSVQIR
jgi:predicted nucleic acid-binding protein